MTDVLAVLIGDDVAGEIRKLRDGRMQFTYFADYASGENATPLSLSMPVAVATHTHRVVESWVRNLLPDNEATLQQWGRRFAVPWSSPYALLGTPVGEDCPGAVRFVPPGRVDAVLQRRGRVEWLTEHEVETRLEALERDPTDWFGDLTRGQFSLAGAQAKTALHRRDGRWGVPVGPVPTTHIVKPSIPGLPHHDLNEHLCLRAAANLGIASAETTLERFGDRRALIVTRFDRRETGRRFTRVHSEDLAQALARPPDQKYEADGGPNAHDIATLYRRVLPRREANDAIARFADALGWNWIIAGTDAHAKNYSVILAGDNITLAPMYDVASALPYAVPAQKLRLAMSLGGEYRLRVHAARHWHRAAKELGLSADALIPRIAALAEQAPNALAAARATASLTKEDRQFADRLTSLIESRAIVCRRMLETD